MKIATSVLMFLLLPGICLAQNKQPHVDEIIKQYDSDGDGVLTPQEVSASRRYSSQFPRWDVDQDKQVTKQEIVRFRAKFGIAADGTMSAPNRRRNSGVTEPSKPFTIPDVEDLARIDRDHRAPRERAANSEFVLRTTPHPVDGQRYFILTDHTETAYLDALKRLAEHRRGEVITVKDLATLHENETEFEAVRKQLRGTSNSGTAKSGKTKSGRAKFVAIAPRLESFRENMVLGMWELLTTLDEDPELDCFPGFLVASNEESFSKLINQSINHQPISAKQLRPLAINQVQNSRETRSLQKSGILRKHFQKANLETPIVAIYGQSADSAPRLEGEKVWNLKVQSRKQFVKQFPEAVQQELAKANLVLMHGHGIPGMSCSVDVDGIPDDCRGKILLSGSCFSASPAKSDLPKMGQAPGGYRVEQREAFVLRAIDNGAIVAFGHQRLSSGFPHLFPVLEDWTKGQTVGQAYQQLMNALIKFNNYQSGKYVVQEDQKQNRRLPQNSLLYVVIGDPALQPLESQPLLK